jgi:REP element-mobilizing transposase RayT
MPRRETQLCAGEYYHIYNRGNNRQPIFFEQDNYLFFLRQWRRYVSSVCDVVAYCLMPTHFHILVLLTADGFSHGMQLLGISYTKAMNERYGRVGALFQGAFQTKHIERNEYLLHLSRYVHLNPVLAGLVSRAEEWEFSSYREYLGLRHGTLPVSDIVLGQFPAPDAYRVFVESYAPRDGGAIADLTFED